MKLFQKYTGKLRQAKLAYWMNNLIHYNQLKPNKNSYSKLGIKKSIWQSISHADIAKPSQEIPWLDKAITSAEIQQQQGFQYFPPNIKQKILDWPGKGYMILENFFSDDETGAANTDIDLLLQKNKIDFNFTGRKIMDAWKSSKGVENIFRQEKIIEILSFIMGREAMPFQTINFQKGSEQRPHSDTIHMTTEPLGYLIATWTALENIQEGAGLLEYYPGSHKLPYVLGEDFETGHTLWQLGADTYPNYEEKIAEIIAAYRLKPQYFNAKKGDVLIWHANLLHGGSPITIPSSSRRSQVCHYFGKDVLCYHEISQRPAIIK